MKNDHRLLLLLFLCAGCITELDTDLRNRTVMPLAPADTIVTNDTAHTFFWNPLEGATQYQLQIVSPRFDSIAHLVADTLVATNRVALVLPRSLSYQWRVRALNASSSTAYSDTFHLTIR